MVDTVVLAPMCTFQYGHVLGQKFLKWHKKEGRDQAELPLGMNRTGHNVCKETLRP